MASVDTLLLTQFMNYINENVEEIGLSCYVTFGAPITFNGQALWVQALGGNATTKYLRGKYKGQVNFALYYRLSESETDGTEVKLIVPHEQLAAWIDSNPLPTFSEYTIQSITQTQSASPFRKGEDGNITYQSLWQINFSR